MGLTAAIVGLSDLTINACFTSTAVETIGRGRPALYYDPTDRIRESFFRAIPGFVCGSGDLEERVNELLWRTDAAARAAYLAQHFDELEGHFDGLAITRLRELLHAHAHMRAA